MTRLLAPRFFLLLVLAAATAVFSGCASLPTSHRTSHDAASRAAAIKKVVVLPLDVEVSELSAGGITEKREDWTRTVAENLGRGIAARTSFRAVTPPTTLDADEVREVQSLFRAISANQFFHSFYGPGLLESTRGPLNYKLGSLAKLTEAAGADAAFVVFVRDDYATGGRKAVAVLGALTGIPVRTGITITSAALVHRDGTLLWMNYTGVNHGDLRTQEGADDALKRLLVNVPAVAAR